MKLNIGAGTKIIEGWINIDILPRDRRLLMMDARKLGFINNSIDEIKAEDVLEHISFRETISVLKEWYRVLKKEGKIYIRVPNLTGWAIALLKHKASDDFIVEHLYGHQDYETNFHKAGFTMSSLKKKMEFVGFKNIRFESNEEDTNVHLWAQK